MATVTESGLFPPIIDSYIPAISIDSIFNENAGNTPGIWITFNIDYNSPSDIHGVHVTITRQSNYNSIFDPDNYQRGVYIATDMVHVEGNVYKVLVPASVLYNQQKPYAELAFNEYYKVQVRLSKEDTYDGETGEDLSRYLTSEANLIQFSEWSTVSLLKFIAKPNFVLDYNGEEFTPGTDAYIYSSNLTISGVYEKDDLTEQYPTAIRYGKNDSQYLSTYQVKLFTNDELVFDSGECSSDRNTPNSFVYTLPFFFQPSPHSGQSIDVNYKLAITYVTEDMYEQTDEYNFGVDYDSSQWSAQTDIQEAVAIDTMIGKVNITFESQDETQPVQAGSKLTIRRGCDKDGFLIWDTVYQKVLTEDLTTALSFDDFTIESGNLYKYEITYSPDGQTNYSVVEGPVMSIFDHAFLTAEGTQLCVKFNPQISSYKTNVGDNMVTTIGGKFPYFSRNGNMYYRSFSLSGTIAYEMDLQHRFASRSNIYGEWIEVYGSYFVNHFMNQRNDRITQRKFRELVMTFLQDEEPKLFRSTPEGNILVRLSDVSFSPKNELGRMIYDFSCTATEIGDATIENCKLYKIQDFGD